MTVILTPDQLADLTGKRRSDAQRRELDYLRVPYKVRRDGSLIVLRRDVEPGATIAQQQEHEPELQP